MNDAFYRQIFRNSFWQKALPSISLETLVRVFQIYGWAFEVLRENQKLGSELESVWKALPGVWKARKCVWIIKWHMLHQIYTKSATVPNK